MAKRKMVKRENGASTIIEQGKGIVGNVGGKGTAAPTGKPDVPLRQYHVEGDAQVVANNPSIENALRRGNINTAHTDMTVGAAENVNYDVRSTLSPAALVDTDPHVTLNTEKCHFEDRATVLIADINQTPENYAGPVSQPVTVAMSNVTVAGDSKVILSPEARLHRQAWARYYGYEDSPLDEYSNVNLVKDVVLRFEKVQKDGAPTYLMQNVHVSDRADVRGETVIVGAGTTIKDDARVTDTIIVADEQREEVWNASKEKLEPMNRPAGEQSVTIAGHAEVNGAVIRGHNIYVGGYASVPEGAVLTSGANVTSEKHVTMVGLPSGHIVTIFRKTPLANVAVGEIPVTRAEVPVKRSRWGRKSTPKWDFGIGREEWFPMTDDDIKVIDAVTDAMKPFV